MLSSQVAFLTEIQSNMSYFSILLIHPLHSPIPTPIPTPTPTPTPSHPQTLLFELFRQLRHGCEQVGDEAIVCDLEDGRLRVLVDGYNCLGVFHAGQVLDRTGDAFGGGGGE
ncbi:hypothetical protein BC938DRAFT_474051 [Jimgerdemannia flammicorona]|uniref:Uncharacterized protein n=1 Tax=Jimgerdemannia flammicorona TaxID=994334 RepID=A0A433QSU3_9FUNG|nr:hypothetical protein BC938DRAFT_474051 [Jimgerdemannia flammicorona]